MAMRNLDLEIHPAKRAISLVLSFAVVLSIFVGISATQQTQHAEAVLATCAAGSSAQNSITVEPSHPTVMYIDSGITPRVDAAYIGYRISNRTGATLKGYWASFDNFTGGSVSLANPLDKYVEVPEIANNDTKTVYVLVKASSASSVRQAHDFKIFNEFPTSTSATNKYGCTFGFIKVAETIQASANKPLTTTIVGGVVPTKIGTTFQVKSTGESGVIGAGSSDVGKIMWFTPAAYSTFPTRAFRLESVQIRIGSKTGLSLSGGNVWIYNDRTYVTPTTAPSADSGFAGEETTADATFGNKRFYENYYTFRIIDAASAAIAPMAQISSGKMIKHSASGAGSSVTVDASSATLPANISKSLVSTDYGSFPQVTIGGSSYTEVPYKITLSTTSTTSVKADQIVDIPALGGIYKMGSTEVSTNSGSTFVAYSDADTLTSESTLSPRPLHFFGPFLFSSSASIVLKYKIYIPAIEGIYSNSATGYIGDRRIISSTTASIPAVKVIVNETGTVTTSETTTVKLLPDPQTKLSSNVDTSTATINGTINPNDTTTAAYFEWGISPTLTSKTTISLGTLTGNTVSTQLSNLTGLTPETTYYFRIVGVASGIRYEGIILNFTTLAQKTAPTIVTESPAGVTLTDATLRATVDPNLTSVYVEFQVWYTGMDTRTVRMVDDPALVFNSNTAQDTYNPYTTFSGSTSQLISIKMSDVAYGLSAWISNGRTIYYRARIVEVTGGAITNAVTVKQFTFASYSDQTITFNDISNITWGAAAPSISPTASSTMTVIRTSLTPSVCEIDGSGNVVILTIGTCAIAANQPGGELSAGVFFNPAPEVIQSFEIIARAITVTAAAKNRYFGDSDPQLTFSLTAGTLSGSDTYTGMITRIAGTNVGVYQIEQNSLSFGINYEMTYVGANFTINPRPITVTAGAKTKVYGQSDPSLTYSLSESLLAGEGSSGALTRANGSNIGTYLISIGTFALSSNYTVTYVPANLTITAKPLTIRADSKTKASGGSQPTFTYTINGLVSPDSITAVDLLFPGPTSTVPTADGNYDITPSNPTFGTGSSSNYTITYETGTYTITNKTPQVLTWTPISSKVYGETPTATAVTSVNPGANLQVTITSLTPSICTVPNSSVSGATVTLLSVGTCQLRATQAGDSTYAPANPADTSFEITAKALTITATVSVSTLIYGESAATSGFTNSTLMGSDAIGSTTLTFTSASPSYTNTAVPSHAGTYTLTPSAPVFTTGLGSNYSINYVTTTYTISAKALSITASSHNITVGDAVPSITASYSAFAFSESAINLTGALNCSTTYTISSTAGTYPSSCSGYSSADYTITYVNGSVIASTAGGTTYTVTYDLGGGSGTTPTETAKSNGASFTTAGSGGFSRSGFTFAGWSCNGVTYGASASITMGSANLICTAQWTQNVSSSNSNAGPAKPVKKVGISSLITIATKPVTAPVVMVEASKAAPKPEPSPSATPGQEPEPIIESNNPLKQTSFTGKGIAKVNVRDEEITIVAKAGFSGNTVVKVQVANDDVISEITANVVVLPPPPANPVAKPMSEEQTRITWLRSPNAIGYEVTQSGELLCNTTSISCVVPFIVPATPAVEIISIGRDKTVSAPIAAKVIERPAPTPKPVQEIPDIVLVINFDTNKYNIDATDRKLIQGFARDVVKYGYKEIDISGHTDSRGGVDNNVLSANRAKAARDYLLTLVPDLKITVGAFADAINVASNSTAAGMAANRRAEFRVVNS